jgi:hypothetical protein
LIDRDKLREEILSRLGVHPDAVITFLRCVPLALAHMMCAARF